MYVRGGMGSWRRKTYLSLISQNARGVRHEKDEELMTYSEMSDEQVKRTKIEKKYIQPDQPA
jgi:hypothetical protein